MKKVAWGVIQGLFGGIGLWLVGCGGLPAETSGQSEETGCAAGDVDLGNGVCDPAGVPSLKTGCAPGEWAALPGSECVPAGLPASTGCAPGETADEKEGCVAAGIPEGGCGEGFLSSDGGCEPVLPATPCGPGEMAIPGESACHPVADCGAGTYGDAPLDADTQFVDISYAGGDSDGSQAKPWTSVQAGVDAAPAGGLVAIAAGTYAEDVAIGDKAVRVWGRCPSLVTIAGTFAAITVTGGDGSEVRGVGITSAGQGVQLVGAQNVSMKHLWTHGTAAHGVRVGPNGAAASTGVSIEDSLVESAKSAGIACERSQAAIRRSSVRGTSAPGFGVVAVTASAAHVADLSIEASVIEGNAYDGVYASGAKVTLASSVVRANRNAEVYAENNGHLRSNLTVSKSVIERAELAGVYAIGSDVALSNLVVRDDDSEQGWGIYLVRDTLTSEGAAGTVTSSLVDHTHGAGIAVYGSSLDVVATVVRDTQEPVGVVDTPGVGIWAEGGEEAGGRASVSVKGSVVADNHVNGILVYASDATIDASKITGTKGILDGGEAFFLGRGVEITDGDAGAERSVVTISRSSVIGNHEAGVLVAGSDCTVESSEIRETLASPKEGRLGRGIQVQGGEMGARSSVTVRGSVVADNQDAGVFVVGSDATLEGTVIERTAPAEAAMRRGVGVDAEVDVASGERGSVVLRGSLIAENHAAGLLSWGASIEAEYTLIRDTLPEVTTGLWGRGAMARVEETTGSRGALAMYWSRVENSVGMGVGAYGSDLVVESCEIVGTQPNEADGTAGNGVQVWSHAESGQRAIASVRTSLLSGNHSAGVLASGAEIELLGVRVEGTQPEASSGYFGRGIGAQFDFPTQQRATLVARDCHVTGSRDIGVFVAGSDATIAHTVVEDTAPREKDGLFGDGVVALSFVEPAKVSVEGSRILRSDRAGVATFGSKISVGSTRVECADFELDEEPYGGEQPSLEDLGDNLCGCPEAVSECHVLSKELEPPDRQEVGSPG